MLNKNNFGFNIFNAETITKTNDTNALIVKDF